jgi:hypothetical protein
MIKTVKNIFFIAPWRYKCPEMPRGGNIPLPGKHFLPNLDIGKQIPLLFPSPYARKYQPGTLEIIWESLPYQEDGSRLFLFVTCSLPVVSPVLFYQVPARGRRREGVV